MIDAVKGLLLGQLKDCQSDFLAASRQDPELALFAIRPVDALGRAVLELIAEVGPHLPDSNDARTSVGWTALVQIVSAVSGRTLADRRSVRIVSTVGSDQLGILWHPGHGGQALDAFSTFDRLWKRSTGLLHSTLPSVAPESFVERILGAFPAPEQAVDVALDLAPLLAVLSSGEAMLVDRPTGFYQVSLPHGPIATVEAAAWDDYRRRTGVISSQHAPAFSHWQPATRLGENLGGPVTLTVRCVLADAMAASAVAIERMTTSVVQDDSLQGADSQTASTKKVRKGAGTRKTLKAVEAKASSIYATLRKLGDNQSAWAEELECDRSLIPRLNAWKKFLEELDRKAGRTSVRATAADPKILDAIRQASEGRSPEDRDTLETLIRDQERDGKDGN